MDTVKKSIGRGVSLTCVTTDKFKTGCIGITLCLPLSRKNAAKNALLPKVLRRGCARYPDMESLSAALDSMYGADVEPIVTKMGEVQCIGFCASVPDDAYVPENGLLEKIFDLVGQILLFPATRSGLLNPDYVKSERENLCDGIRARINDKQRYAMCRLREIMCAGEAAAEDALGRLEDAAKITPITLTKHYKKILESAWIEVFYCGGADAERVESAALAALAALPREGEPEMPGTLIKTDAVKTKYFTEKLNVTQGQLALGFRMGEYMRRPDFAAMRVFGGIYGEQPVSKLFLNVREKLSLCYLAMSGTDREKGLMLVSAGIDFDKYDRALEEILAQLEAVRKGDFSDAELEASRRQAINSVKSIQDSQLALYSFYLRQSIDGLDYGPEVFQALLEAVTREDVLAAGETIKLDTVYFLRGETENGTENV